MTDLVVENLRLKELILVVNKNKPFFDEFIKFINSYGYPDIYSFINERNEEKLITILNQYFDSDFENTLFDGIARPYNQSKSKWFFITWLLRDAPQQRLQPIISNLSGSTNERRIWILRKIIHFVSPLLPKKEQWEWPAISEVMLQRLEGSRRSLKGNLFEAIIRTQLNNLIKKHKLSLLVTQNEVKLNDETYDIEVVGLTEKILMPVKTRETMGGGHALLFTRDIHKSISVAHQNGFECIPVIIAESWTGNLKELNCNNYIHIQINPNQVDKINPLLEDELESLIAVFQNLR
ncbi:hypothetical protein SCQ05_04270 [Legionella pneumophila serogroup 1]|nr:hypothetical protein [Legionella pneumophila]HBI5778506.1 hypothetical protein [Legionella pneumophila]HBJ7666211.1 hypothetical protein [Legionella pneumophila]HDU8068259.1 hypothetical protein [Legionella pneumophila]